MTSHLTIVLASAALAATAQTSFAQSAPEDIAELKARVDALETELATIEATEATRPRLAFSVGENTTIHLYGFVRAEAFYDLDFAQGDLTRAGRVGDPAFATDGEFDTSVRVTRFGIRSNTNTGIGPVATQLEFDLFGSGGDESTSPNLRLRHANLTINDSVLIGQFWTNFMPLQHYPTTADFNGPVGITFARVPQIRYTYRTEGGLQFSGSIEEAAGGASDPVLTAAVAYDGGRYSLRAAGLTGTFESGGTSFNTNGVTVSGAFTPFDGTTLSATYITGEGQGNLLIGGGARAVGGEVNQSDGFTVALSQRLSDTLTFNLSYGSEAYSLPTAIGTSGSSFTDLQSVHAGIFYRPVDNLTLAAEYINIRSEGAGFEADADRIGLSATLSF